VLSLPVDAQRKDTRAREDFGKWMVKNIDSWFAFARGLGLGIEQMEEIVLVTGLHLTRSWANVAFWEGHANGQASIGVNVTRGPEVTVDWQCLPGSVQGGVRSWGPEGKVGQFGMDSKITLKRSCASFRTCQRTNVYFYEGFVSLVSSGYYGDGLEGLQDLIQVRTGIMTTMS
jgi:hypothetical protein